MLNKTATSSTSTKSGHLLEVNFKTKEWQKCSKGWGILLLFLAGSPLGSHWCLRLEIVSRPKWSGSSPWWQCTCCGNWAALRPVAWRLLALPRRLQPSLLHQVGTTTNAQAVKSLQTKSEQKMIKSILKISKMIRYVGQLIQHIAAIQFISWTRMKVVGCFPHKACCTCHAQMPTV